MSEYSRPYSVKGLLEMLAGLLPTNLNPKTWMVDSYDIHGGQQIVKTVGELIGFHPFKMKKGMKIAVIDYPQVGIDSTFKLNTPPENLVDGNENSIITEETWRQFWDEEYTSLSTFSRVYQYAPDKDGGQPPFPYTTDEGLRFEDQWVATRNVAKGHKWLRFRDDDAKQDYTDPDAGPDITVYDNWTVPIAIANQFVTGDFIENRFKREALDDTPVTDPINLVLNKFYSVDLGTATATDDTNPARTFDFGKGAYFEVQSGFIYTFAVDTSCTLVPDIPRRTLPDGSPNNEPIGWTDSVPVGGDQLWKIFAQKSVYGQLKSEWLLEKIIEIAEYTRYSDRSAPLPSTLCPTTASVDDADPANPPNTYDETLEAEGWNKTFDESKPHIFIATRRDETEGVPGPDFTPWAVEKIGDESGEFIDYVYKLFPINADYDDVILTGKPVGRDPSDQGWTDTPQVETETDVNYVSQARKFFDGTLKTEWSDPIPYTARDIYIDTINLPDGLDFKFDPNDPNTPTIPIPDELRLIGELYYGNTPMWKNSANTIAYKWEKIFDDGAALNPAIEIVSNDPDDDAYLKLATPVAKTGTVTTAGIAVTGTSTLFSTEFSVGRLIKVSSGQIREIATIDDDTNLTVTVAFNPDVTAESIEESFQTEEELSQEYRDNQILVVKHPYIVGKAFFRCTQTLTTSEGDIVFQEVVDIIDITDGSDAKALEASADTQLVIWDTVAVEFNPAEVNLTALFANLHGVTQLYWYFNNGAGYTEIDGTEAAYTLGGDKDQLLNIDVTQIFTGDNTAENLQFAISTITGGQPTDADGVTNLSDYVTVAKSSSAGIGTEGEDAAVGILTNEAYTVVLDSATLTPFASETGPTGTAQTDIQVFNGNTRMIYNTDYTLNVTSAQSADISWTLRISPNNANDANVYLDTFNGANIRSANINIEITLTASGRVIDKQFSLATTIDSQGAILMTVTSNKGFQFDRNPGGLDTKTFTAFLWEQVAGSQTSLDPAPYYWRWSDGIGSILKNWTQGVSGRSLALSRTQVFVDANIIVQASLSPSGSPVFSSFTFRVSDITDGRTYVMYNDLASPSNPSPTTLSNWDANNLPSGWSKTAGASTQSTVQGHETEGSDPITITWEGPTRIGGEDGDQGQSGGFSLYMYKNNGTSVPSSNATLEQMWTAGWTYKPPIPVAGQRLYSTQQVWDGYTPAGDPSGNPVQFDGNGKPDNGSAGARGYWHTPAQLSGLDGADGATGDTGIQGAIGPRPDHQWSGTSLRFENAVGSWGSYVDLKGATGNTGATGATGATGPAWTDPSWTDLGRGIDYRRDGQGRVNLRQDGVGNTFISGTPIGTLPSAYKPILDISFFLDHTPATGETFYIKVTTSGTVTMISTNGSSILSQGLYFIFNSV